MALGSFESRAFDWLLDNDDWEVLAEIGEMLPKLSMPNYFLDFKSIVGRLCARHKMIPVVIQVAFYQALSNRLNKYEFLTGSSGPT